MKNGDTITILHASDFHVKEDEGDPLSHSHDIRALFVFDAEQKAKELGAPTVMIFSGDIAFSGKAEQYDVARCMFTDILKRLNLKDQRILVVPGNHDINRPKAEGLDARMLRDQLRAKTDRDAEKVFIAKRQELLEPLSEFHEFALPYDCLIQGDNGYWEIDNTTGSSASEYLSADFQVLIRGISTVHASDRNDDQMKTPEDSEDDGSHMYIARGQLTCDPMTDEGPFRIIVGHHPPSWWRFKDDRKGLADVRYHLHLFGHEHEFSPQLTGNAVCVKAGAINPEEAEDEQPRYNWIKIKRNETGFIVRIWSRVFDKKGEKFDKDNAWPEGQGYHVDFALENKPTLIPPEEMVEVTDEIAAENEMAKLDDIEKDEDEQASIMPPSPHAVRFALLSQNHARYALVFKMLGYVPNGEQKLTLGGLEYYEEKLKTLLLPENIDELITAMKAEGINVD